VIKITWDHGFKRAYKKRVKNDEELRKRFWDAMELFSTNVPLYLK
jgi:mRNA-degrading endonuclease YafQ of YafQ-DinJ toxin-antitoxin module